MKIIVDADACPGREIIESVARKYEIELVMYCDMNHVLSCSYGEVKYVESGFQSVDIYVANAASASDIIVTQDYGVAAMVLGKKAYAVSPKGNIYSDNNIEKLLFERHISQKVRKGGGRTSNPKKRTAEDDLRLEASLIKLIEKAKNE